MRAPIMSKTLAGLAVLLTAGLCQAAELSVADLMQMLGQKKSGTATFVEKKYIAMLKQPLESSGELAFTAPDRLEKRTLKPKAESVLLEGNKLTLERSDGRKMTVALSDRPEVAAFVESIRATLSGDRGGLERFYTLALSGDAEQWKLNLTPIQPRMQKVISQIRIAGKQAQVKTIEFQQADGDRSEMAITSTSAK
ncbi:LolA-related protein [Pseudogulbenkiania sp. NH8B]|uniref:LolA-related protein n=1 Tax=Pseudogulbenkiania sp. (strain NH8B) TaxID=748280 RepID=UPI000684DA47|nr:LolA-related protein [Pseudogulbenkiania sp. NH8B]